MMPGQYDIFTHGPLLRFSRRVCTSAGSRRSCLGRVGVVRWHSTCSSCSVHTHVLDCLWSITPASLSTLRCSCQTCSEPAAWIRSGVGGARSACVARVISTTKGLWLAADLWLRSIPECGSGTISGVWLWAQEPPTHICIVWLRKHLRSVVTSKGVIKAAAEKSTVEPGGWMHG